MKKNSSKAQNTLSYSSIFSKLQKYTLNCGILAPYILNYKNLTLQNSTHRLLNITITCSARDLQLIKCHTCP